MKKNVRRYFNDSAASYDAAAVVQSYIANQLVACLSPTSVKTILEIGCGTGTYSQQLLTLYPDAQLLLTDIAPAMVQKCQSRFSAYPQVATQCIDGELLPLTGVFDLITSNMVFQWYENLKFGLKNSIDKLTTGGQLIFSTLGANSLIEWRQYCDQFNISAGTPSFSTIEEITHSFPELSIKVETFQHEYTNAYSFLSSLKSLGARASKTNHIPVNSGQLRKLLRSSTAIFPVTYEVIYGCYQKP